MAQEEENKPVVTFLGPIASYTHQAALSVFNPQTHNLQPTITIEDVFSTVQSGTSTHGVVPFENSSNGSVVFTLDLFADLHAKYPDILVCDEAYISVQHCLLGHDPHSTSNSHSTTNAPSALQNIIESPLSSGAVTPTSKDPSPVKPTTRPVADISRIKKLYSHPQAWGQCKAFLNTYLKGVERQDVSSTSRAAELVAGDESGTSAAISSIIAARIHGLDVLAKGIEDRADNTTRFFVLKKRQSNSPTTNPPPNSVVDEEGETGKEKDGGEDREDEGKWKTLISFTIDHKNPGALAHSLAVFEKYGLNLTSINTRPSGVENWNYIFFVEIMGRRVECGDEGKVNRALADLGRVCRGWRWLGSWEDRLGR